MGYSKKLSSSLFILLGCVILLCVQGCSHQVTRIPTNSEAHFNKTTFSFDRATYPTELDLFPIYRLSPGDVLDVLFQITTWKKRKTFKIAISHTVSVKFVDLPSLDETQRVLPNGTIVLPYIGSITVVGKTIPELTRELRQRYSKVLRDPEIYVTVPEFRSRIKELKTDLHTAPRGLSRLVTVRPDGYVTFPLVGDLFVAHRTIPEVKKILNKRYDKFLPGLHVDLFLQRHAAAIVYVVGEVARPGAYKIMRPISIIESIALAGGYKSSAEMRSIVVFRKHERKVVARVLNQRELLEGNTKESFFYLRPDDIVFVPRRRVSTLAQLMREMADIVLFNGWGSGVSFSHSF